MLVQPEQRLDAHFDAGRIVSRVVDGVMRSSGRGKGLGRFLIEPLSLAPIELIQRRFGQAM